MQQPILSDTLLISATSNFPCEDTIYHISIKFSSSLNYSLFGVYDGHNGNYLSNFLVEILGDAILTRLAKLYSQHAAASTPDHVEDRSSKDHPNEDQQFDIREEELGAIKGLHKGMPDPNPSDEEIDQYIKKAFLAVDSFIVHTVPQQTLDDRLSKETGVKLLLLANAGSCVLVGIYNNVKRTFKVALTGDSRAVLGRRVAVKEDAYAYETHVLSVDQNAHNPKEVERLQAAHPGEKLFEGGRVLGWGMSRAFGDAAYKWSREIQQRIHEEYLGDRPRANCLTPPYFTAEPEITTTTIRKGDFVVLASDGLWDCLTNEEVVGLVGGWLETRGEEVKIGKGEGIGEGEMVMVPFGKTALSGRDHRTGFGKGKGNGWDEGRKGDSGNKVGKKDESTIWERTDLPVTSLKPDETPMYNWWHATKRFLNIDGNAAVHLARNALGGADRDLTGALLRLTPPRTRRAR
jgi:pyruvate dehydrogenase phosphatase